MDSSWNSSEGSAVIDQCTLGRLGTGIGCRSQSLARPRSDMPNRSATVRMGMERLAGQAALGRNQRTHGLSRRGRGVVRWTAPFRGGRGCPSSRITLPAVAVHENWLGSLPSRESW